MRTSKSVPTFKKKEDPTHSRMEQILYKEIQYNKKILKMIKNRKNDKVCELDFG